MPEFWNKKNAIALEHLEFEFEFGHFQKMSQPVGLTSLSESWTGNFL